MCPYKSRTKIFNPTKEKPVHSLECTFWDLSITNEEKKNEPEPSSFVCLRCCNQGSRGGFTPVTIQVGIGSFSGFTYRSLLSPLGPQSMQMSHFVDG